ncbi:MAG: PP2C family serine/threonine-protein phosphatase [Sandaracinaceae bacterium]
MEFVGSRVLPASAAPPAPAVRVEAPFEGVVLGLSAGDDVDMRSKTAPNEDSVGAVSFDGATVIFVADAHFGPASSELAVDLLARRLKRSPEADLFELVQGVAQAVENDDLSRGRSETTLLVARVTEHQVAWVSVGDSFLFVLGADGSVTTLSTTSASYVGQHGLAAALPADIGTHTLRDGDWLLLATDGIEPESSGLDLEEVARVLRSEAPEASVTALLKRAGTFHTGGGGDNLGVALLVPAV